MSSTRSIIAPPVFASSAATVIPPTPIAGVSYRDPIAGPASSANGWPYAERVNSAEFNQIMYQLSSIAKLVDMKGILGWSDQVDYTEVGIVFGSDGEIYKFIQPSGPNNGGARDPISSPTFWGLLKSSGSLIGVQRFIAAGSFSYTKTPGAKFAIVDLVGGGGAGGGASITNASQISIGAGGASGARAKALIDLTSISGSVAITVGAAGAPASGGSGGNGGATSFGVLLTASGGGGGLLGGAETNTTSTFNPGANGPTGTTGGNILSSSGSSGGDGLYFTGSGGFGGQGADSPMLGGGGAPKVNLGSAGANATSNGAGGGGAASTSATGVVRAGGQGSPGMMIIEEYF